MKNLHLHIYGRVQGVGFRYNAKLKARSLGLLGFAKNMPDDSVYIEVEGDENSLEEFSRWCNIGPEHAIVEKVNIEEGEIKHFNSFETKF